MSNPSSVTVAYRANRITRLRKLMAEKKVEGLLVTNFADVSYLTGFEGEDSFLLVTPEKVGMISDSRYEEQIGREATGLTDIVMRKKLMVEEASALVKKYGIDKLGVQAEHFTLKQKEAYEKELPKVTIVPTDELIIGLRHIKDDYEIGIIEQSIAAAEHAYSELKWEIKPGMTEADIANMLVFYMRRGGATGPSFETIVAAGANGSLPHYRPRRVPLENNSSLLIDWGAKFGGYCSDLTRVIFIGKPPEKIKEIYAIVLEAQQTAIAAIKPGMNGKEVDKVARDIINKAGYEKEFGHGLGHGLGRDIHEPIAFSKLSNTEIKPGMVLTVEPGIYLSGIGGVRLEEDILVTERGCRVLTQLPNDLNSARLEEKPRRRHAVD